MEKDNFGPTKRIFIGGVLAVNALLFNNVADEAGEDAARFSGVAQEKFHLAEDQADRLTAFYESRHSGRQRQNAVAETTGIRNLQQAERLEHSVDQNLAAGDSYASLSTYHFREQNKFRKIAGAIGFAGIAVFATTAFPTIKKYRNY